MSDLPAVPTTRALGQSGITISSLAWGMWRFAGPAAAARQLVDAALDIGITLFDTADIYGFDGSGGFGDAESLLGELFAADPGLRGRMVLASKGGIMPPLPYDSSAAYLVQAIDASLQRLQTDVIDLWQVHRPDILTHPQEVAGAVHKALAAGKIRAIGVSNCTPAQIAALQHFLDVPLASTQPELSPLRIDPFENGELDQAMQMGMAVLAWSPLGGGRLAEPTNDRERAVVAALDAVAAAHGVSRTAAAYSWLMAHPARPIPIVGTQNVARIAEAADAFAVGWTRTSWYDVFVAARGEKLP
ncbi:MULTISPECIES: aldo/keto reductase [unclassified Sphingopyxis]|jgi:predicted oxidoreductase|uniref:aldo/keto reductase n=1 Tax=unclassified Sphingopyxis TaxID=2614943 RepID=UPI00285AF1BE|nr:MULTISPECIES: aldo/keto reductase [unclassified Sphingopyxis]MDR6833215.1 putative oxidoreductase [Sphingopyxis sp. BE122]MDR7225484.1 putative oxidoreductase [Sphingopyxis sp. BE259]